MFANPTRRTGPRTGAVGVPTALIDRIMRALVKKGQRTPKGLVIKFESRPPMPLFLRKAIEAHGGSTGGPRVERLRLGAFRVPNYVTGRAVNVPVFLSQGSAAAGLTSIALKGERRTSKAERRQRVLAALQRLHLTLPVKTIEDLTESIFSWNSGLEVEIDLPAHALSDADLRRARAVLAHELTHVADEAARRYHARESAKSDVLTDIDMITDALGLPDYVAKKHEQGNAAPRHGAQWVNDREEVTAMIREIMEEIGSFPSSIAGFRLAFILEGKRRPKTRERELVSFLRSISPTFREYMSEWTPENLNRVLRAMWDRYHSEPGFPRATGVYKNRRTSRRRTSRR